MGYYLENMILKQDMPATNIDYIHFYTDVNDKHYIMFSNSFEVNSVFAIYEYIINDPLQSGLDTNTMKLRFLKGTDVLKSYNLEFQIIDITEPKYYLFWGYKYDVV
jgi:hypothetical protein